MISEVEEPNTPGPLPPMTRCGGESAARQREVCPVGDLEELFAQVVDGRGTPRAEGRVVWTPGEEVITRVGKQSANKTMRSQDRLPARRAAMPFAGDGQRAAVSADVVGSHRCDGVELRPELQYDQGQCRLLWAGRECSRATASFERVDTRHGVFETDVLDVHPQRSPLANSAAWVAFRRITASCTVDWRASHPRRTKHSIASTGVDRPTRLFDRMQTSTYRVRRRAASDQESPAIVGKEEEVAVRQVLGNRTVYD